MGSSSATGGMKSRNGGGRNRGRQLGEGGNTTHRANKQEERCDEGPKRATSGVGGVVVGTSWSSKSRPTQGAAHRPGQPFLILNIESYAAARGRGGGGCGVVEVDIWRRARYGSGTNNTGRSRRRRESTERIKKETRGSDSEKETRKQSKTRDKTEQKRRQETTTRKREQREERENERKRGAGIEEVPRGAHRQLTAGYAGRIVSSVQ